MANKDAFRIFNFSISFKEANPTLQIEFFFIYFSKIFLFSFESFLESFILLLSIFFLNITAAAHTGPTKLPLPTSSTPATFFLFKKKMINN